MNMEKQKSFQIAKMEKQTRGKESPGKQGDSPLHLAARVGNLLRVKEILQNCDSSCLKELVSKQNQEGETPLYVAAKNGHALVVGELLKQLDPATASIVARNGYDPFHVAAKQGHIEVLKEFLHSFPNLAMTMDLSNSTALHTAAAQGHIDVVNLLLETDVNLAKIARNNGKTVLHTVARMGHLEVVNSILNTDPSIGFRKDKKGQTALHMAVKGQSVGIVLELLKHDPSVLSLEDNKGNTALHTATKKGRIQMIQCLLSVEGINVNAINKDGESPLDIAEKFGTPEIASILREAGATNSKDQGKPPNPAKQLKLTVSDIKHDVESLHNQSRQTVFKVQKIAKRQKRACVDLLEVVFRLFPLCQQSGTSKRFKSSFELLKLKVELLFNLRDALEEEITKELMLGKKPIEESHIWLTRVEKIESQVRALLELEQKGSRFDAALHESLTNLLNEIVECLEKSPLVLGRMVDAPSEKTKSERVTKAKPDIYTGISPSQGKEIWQDNEMRQPKDAETLIAPSTDWSIPIHEFEKKYDTGTAKGKMMQRSGTEARTVSTAGKGGSLTPALSDESEAESEMVSFSKLGPASSFKSAANPEIIRHPITEVSDPSETEIELISFKAEEMLSRPETEILSIYESETDSVPSTTEEVDQVGPNPGENLNISTEPTLPIAVSVAGPINSADDTLLIDHRGIELHCQTEGGHVLAEPRINVKRSIQHTVNNILQCINDVNTRRIGIYGNGGIGKTTVLKSLIGYPELKDMFDLIILVSVSRYWSTRKIQNDIVRQLALSPADTEIDSEIAAKLFEALRSRKFLFLLDDVWDWIDLDAVGIPDHSKAVGCRIIIATRSLDVCHIMAADREIKVEGLSRDEAWGLFHEQLGKIIDSPDIHPFARDIVDECGGLPLTLIVTGRALRDEKDVLVWRHALKEFFLPSTARLHGTEDVIQQLKFSYDRLRDLEMKSFFLYCALFPEDHDINISAVIEYCIQEGLVAGDLGDARKKGHNIVEFLVSAALLERREDGISVNMHDVIRDLAIGILSTNAEASQFLVGADMRLTQPPSMVSRSLESSGRNKLLLSEGHQFLLRAGVGLTEAPSKKEWENAVMICLMDNKLSSLPKTLSCPNLLTLFLQRNKLLRVMPMSFFDCMPSLQVLNLSETRIKSLPQSLSKLISLKALILRDCDRLAMLPSEVGLLGKLEILDLHGTEINKLPNEISKLVCLKHLEVSFYGSTNRGENVKLPPELVPGGTISSFLALEKLSVVVYPGDQRWSRSVKSVIMELGCLTKLTVLCFYFPEVEFLELFLRMSPSWKGKGLTKFNFVVGHNVKRIVARVPEDVDLDFGRRGQCLRLVNSDMIPEAVVEVLTRTKAFYLDHHLSIGSLSEFGLGNIRRLEFCVIRECPEMHTIIDRTDVDNAALPFLERLTIHYLWKLRRIWEDMMPSGSFARLRILSVHTCPKLSFVFSRSMLQCVANLEELIVEDCPAITEIILQDNVFNPGFSILPGLKKLTLHYLPKLVNIWKGPWPSLEQISFYNCSNLKNIGMDSKLKHTLKEIRAEKDWWDALEWEETTLFLHLQARFNQITDDHI